MVVWYSIKDYSYKQRNYKSTILKTQFRSNSMEYKPSLENMKRLSLAKSLMMFGVPSIYFIAITRFLTPYLIKAEGVHPALSWFITGYLVFLPLFIAAILLVKRETGNITWHVLLERLRIKKLTKNDVRWTIGSTILILVVTGLIMAVSKELSAVFGIHELQTTPSFMQIGVLHGHEQLYLLIWLPMFLFNIVGEQMLWQGYILPRQELEHGSKAWFVNASLWMMFHLCFGLDLMIILLPTLFIITYTIQKTKNTVTGMIAHAVLNGPMFVAIALGLIK